MRLVNPSDCASTFDTGICARYKPETSLATIHLRYRPAERPDLRPSDGTLNSEIGNGFIWDKSRRIAVILDVCCGLIWEDVLNVSCPGAI